MSSQWRHSASSATQHVSPARRQFRQPAPSRLLTARILDATVGTQRHNHAHTIQHWWIISTKIMPTARVFTQVRHVRIFTLTCTASSRTGASIKALMPVGLCCFKWCMIGSTNAAVFPLPVGAHAMIFRFWQYKNRTNTVDDARSICTNTKHNYRTYIWYKRALKRHCSNATKWILPMQTVSVAANNENRCLMYE